VISFTLCHSNSQINFQGMINHITQKFTAFMPFSYFAYNTYFNFSLVILITYIAFMLTLLFSLITSLISFFFFKLIITKLI